MSKMLAELLNTRDIQKFCYLFSRIANEPARLSLLFREACVLASSHLYPENYLPPHYFVPHSYMGLIASWQMRKYVPASDRWLPMVQAFWYFSHEVDRWGVDAREPSKGKIDCPDDLSAAMNDAWVKGDPGTLYSLYAGCQGKPGTRESALRNLLSLALKDHTNVGHKYIYLTKVIQLSQLTRWRDPVVFYAPVHFLARGPKDLAMQSAAETLLQSLDGNAEDLASGRKAVEYARIPGLCQAVMAGPEECLQSLLELVKHGYSLESIQDSLLLIASKMVYFAPADDLDFWWVYPVHGFGFISSVNYGLKFMEPGQKVLAMFMCGLHLYEAARAVGSIKMDESIDFSAGAGKYSLAGLGEAIESTSAADALEQMRGIIANKTSFSSLTEQLALLSSMNEKFFFTHAIKYLYNLLPALRKADANHYAQHLLAFTRFLALSKKEREVATIIENPAKP